MKFGNNIFMKIPFVAFDEINNRIKNDLVQIFEDFVDSKYYVLGNKVSEFENEYALFNQMEYCVGLASGLDGLFLALRVLEIGEEDEVIVPSNTYIATVLAISMVGAKPIFCEPILQTYNLDPKKIENLISNKTKAIMPVHLYGQCCEMDTIMEIAQKYNLFVVEDNAQSQGATHKGKMTGSFGHINATSFYPTKNLGALGDAGAITTNSKDYADKMKKIRNYGSNKRYFNEIKGVNSRLDELQAAILTYKLKTLEAYTFEREEIARMYSENLENITEINLPKTHPDFKNVFHLYVIRTQKRDLLKDYLEKNGIGTVIHYPIPPHLQEAYKNLGYKKGDFPIAEEIADTILSLPLYIGMKKEEVLYVCQIIKQFFNV